VVSVLEGIAARGGEEMEVRFEPGCRIHRGTPAFARGLSVEDGDGPASGAMVEFFSGEEFAGEPVHTYRARRLQFSWTGNFAPGVIDGPFSMRARATFVPEESGPHRLTLTSAGLSRLLLDGAVVVDNWTAQTRGSSFYGLGSSEVEATVELAAGEPHEVLLEFRSTTRGSVQGVIAGCLPPEPADQIDRAVALAARANAAVVVVGLNAGWETEGSDRVSMDLPGDQDELIRRVAAVNGRTIVVVNAGSPVTMPWADDVAAILQLWYPGQEGGDALADVLFGDAEPGGRLPDSFPVRVEDNPADLTYPGEAGAVSYGEGVFAGYRGFERRRVAPRFPFGHGLSYTLFAYGDVSVDRESFGPGEDVTVTVAVRNVGDRSGCEVVQVYVRDVESSLLRPEKELKGFAKVELGPGEQRMVRIVLPHRAFAAWDPALKGWVAEPGEFEILVGASSVDLRGRRTIRLTEAATG
jgi:beta-glucosidase